MNANFPNVLVISPPFFSHAKPLLALGEALARESARVTFACIQEMDSLSEDAGLEVFHFEGASNRNTGSTSTTKQSHADAERLRLFLEATRQSAVAALTRQALNRHGDMLPNPERTLDAVRRMCRVVRPDWCLIDQLSYPVTLSLHCLGVPFASFIAGHPTDLPVGESSFGVPDRWPLNVHVDRGLLIELIAISHEVDLTFTGAFNDVIRQAAGERRAEKAVTSAFSFSSEYSRVFNYPEAIVDYYPRREARDLFIGYCMSDRAVVLPLDWQALIDQTHGRPRVLVSFGTFQWVHTDVIRTIHQGVRETYPDSALFIAAGDRVDRLADLADDRTIICEFLPQPALVRHVDIAVHHGGNNSFTEATAAGVPSIVFPFAADQFAIASDVERLRLGRVLDPNHFTAEDVALAIRAVLDGDYRQRVEALAQAISMRGPTWAATRMIEQMQKATHP
jgi:UDP:flavonoid glycosyltransferase YjiC (YdhE family)